MEIRPLSIVGGLLAQIAVNGAIVVVRVAVELVYVRASDKRHSTMPLIRRLYGGLVLHRARVRPH